MQADRDIASVVEDHALEPVPLDQRESWLAITWNTTGLVTSIAMLFLGALVCFVAGVRIALLAGATSFVIGSSIGWAIARVACATGLSNTLITRHHGLGVRGSALASAIFGMLIIGFLAIENALLYKGCLFFFGLADTLLSKLLIYGILTGIWILATAFGFHLVTRFSSVLTVAFLVLMAYMLWLVFDLSAQPVADVMFFDTQLPAVALTHMGIVTDADKYVFGVNILLGPAVAIALNTADFGRYGRSVGDVRTAATIGVFVQSILMALVGGMLVHAGSGAMIEHYVTVQGMSADDARQMVLKSPDSIAAAFIIFGQFAGFALMMAAQAKTQVLNTYSSSLSVANLADALFGWRPGRIHFVVIANIIALLMLYGHILELVEAWIKLLSVLLSALASVIIADFFIVRPRLEARGIDCSKPREVNWIGVASIALAVGSAHYLLKPYQPVEVLTSIVVTLVCYSALMLGFAPRSTRRGT